MPKKSKKPTPNQVQEEQIISSGDIEYQLVSTDLIDDPERPMRTDITPASVEDLVLSIKQVGIIEPLIIKPKNNRYEVIAGHRRLVACKLAKLLQVPCYIRKASNEETEMLKIHENLYRAEISPAEEAIHFSYLIDKQKMTPLKISQLIQKSSSYVMDRLAILEYPGFLKEAMVNGEISFAVAREFARFGDLKQMQSAVYYARRSGMTSDMARKWVKDFQRTKEDPHNEIQTTRDEGNGQNQIEHTSTCVYCREPVKLLEAAVVYMHEKCLHEANAQSIADSKPDHIADSNS